MKKAIYNIMLITIIAKLFGFGREILLSYFFGAGGISDAYLTAQTIPGTIFQFVGTGLATSFIPVYMKAKLQENNKTADQFTKATSQDQGAVLEKIGAEVVYPERDMATRLGKRLISGNFLDFIFLDNDIEIQQVPVSDSLVGKTIREINIRKKYSLNIIAIEHQQDTIIEFAPDYEFLKEDIIVVIGKLQNIRKFERAFS